MTTMTVPTTRRTPTTAVRAGLALAAALGLANIPFLVLDIDWGPDEPPFALLLLNTAIGMVSVVCAVLAWNTGNRRLIRINAAALIVNALMVLPGIFFESPPFITIASAVIVVATVVSVVLMMRRSSEPSRVTGLMSTVDLPHLDTDRNGVDAWAATWLRVLPALALIGPGSWFVAALVRAAGIGTLDDGLDWISGPEGLIMSLGVSFFAATYVLFGMVVARRAPRSGVAVTGLGLLGVTAFGGIAFFRVFMAKFTDEGLDPDAMNDAFEATHIWDLAALTNFANFAAWLVAGIAILRTGVLPRWVGACCIGGVIGVHPCPRRIRGDRGSLAARNRSLVRSDRRRRPSMGLTTFQ